jgi:hypothetical protein
VVQRAKGGINCGHLPNYHAIQETMALKPDYLLVEAISIRFKLTDMEQTLGAPLGWCGKQSQARRFKTLVYATPMGHCKSFRAWFGDPQRGSAAEQQACADAHADACFAWVEKTCRKHELPLIDVGPAVDDWLAKTPAAKFVPHVQADWYHPNQWGAALFGEALAEGIKKHWPELPVRPIIRPVLPGKP